MNYNINIITIDFLSKRHTIKDKLIYYNIITNEFIDVENNVITHKYYIDNFIYEYIVYFTNEFINKNY